MSLPQVLKNFNLFGDGASWLGCVSSVKLPKLATKDESMRTAGMLAEIDVPMGLDSLELEFSCDGYVKTALSQFGDMAHNARLYRFAGATQSPESEEYIAVEVVVRGRMAEIDFGDAELAKKTEHKYKVKCSTFKLMMAGEVLIDVDVVNGKAVIGGVDKTAGLRTALGL